MKTNFVLLDESELYTVYGGRSDQLADIVELLGMGFGIIAKLIDKIRSAFRDAQKQPAQ